MGVNILMAQASKPLVIVLDVDGTIIGDIRPQLQLVDLHNSLKKHDKKAGVFNVREFQARLRQGIVRPYFTKFIKKMKESVPNVEFFIYTASEKKWAHFLIPHIEKAVGIKFNRPIFTRSNCVIVNNECKKTTASIMPGVLKSLKSKYGILSKKDLEDRILIIDNTQEVFDQHNKQFLLHCPTYDFKYPENIPTYVSSSMFDTHHPIITNCLNMRINPQQQCSYLDFQHAFYSHYVSVLNAVSVHNRNHTRDRFFGNLLDILINKQISAFTPKTIAYLRFKLNSSR